MGIKRAIGYCIAKVLDIPLYIKKTKLYRAFFPTIQDQIKSAERKYKPVYKFHKKDIRRGVVCRTRLSPHHLMITHIYRNVKKGKIEVNGVSTDLYPDKHFISIKDIDYILKPVQTTSINLLDED